MITSNILHPCFAFLLSCVQVRRGHHSHLKLGFNLLTDPLGESLDLHILSLVSYRASLEHLLSSHNNPNDICMDYVLVGCKGCIEPVAMLVILIQLSTTLAIHRLVVERGGVF